MDIPILDGEEWWSSEAIDDTSKLFFELHKLAELCLKKEINADKADVLISTLKAYSLSTSIEFDAELWLNFCHQLRDTNLSNQSSYVENMINDFVKKHLSLKVK